MDSLSLSLTPAQVIATNCHARRTIRTNQWPIPFVGLVLLARAFGRIC